MEERATLLSQKGVTIWFTGLSASGKVRAICISRPPTGATNVYIPLLLLLRVIHIAL